MRQLGRGTTEGLRRHPRETFELPNEVRLVVVANVERARQNVCFRLEHQATGDVKEARETAQLHRGLAEVVGDPAFELTAADATLLGQGLHGDRRWFAIDPGQRALEQRIKGSFRQPTEEEGLDQSRASLEILDFDDAACELGSRPAPKLLNADLGILQLAQGHASKATQRSSANTHGCKPDIRLLEQTERSVAHAQQMSAFELLAAICLCHARRRAMMKK